MEDLRTRLPTTLVPNFKMEPPYKVDEGYSEDTRSQDDLDSPMGMEPGSEPLLQTHVLSLAGLSAAVMNLSEIEKAGTCGENIGWQRTILTRQNLHIISSILSEYLPYRLSLTDYGPFFTRTPLKSSPPKSCHKYSPTSLRQCC